MQALTIDSRMRAAMAPPAGAGYVRVERTRADRMAVTHARVASPLRIFAPAVTPRTAWLVTSTLGGGLVGGDHIALSVDVDDDARALLASQASTKIYRSSSLTRQTLEARVGRNALLAVLPDPLAPFAGSTFEQAQSFALADDANLLVLDWLTAGRPAFGERWAFDRYSSRLEVVRAGSRVFYDSLWLSAEDGSVGERMRQFNVYALVVATGPRLQALATDWVSRSEAKGVERGRDLVWSAAPLGSIGAVLRIAGTGVEQVASVIRDFYKPARSFVGEDPWARRW